MNIFWNNPIYTHNPAFTCLIWYRPGKWYSRWIRSWRSNECIEIKLTDWVQRFNIDCEELWEDSIATFKSPKFNAGYHPIVRFLGKAGIDAGGLSSEYGTSLCKELFSQLVWRPWDNLICQCQCNFLQQQSHDALVWNGQKRVHNLRDNFCIHSVTKMVETEKVNASPCSEAIQTSQTSARHYCPIAKWNFSSKYV